MTHRTLVLAVLTVFCLSGADRAYAQEKRALIKKLVEVTDMTGQIKTGAQAATAPIMEQIKQANPTMPADTFTYIQGKVESELSNIMTSFMEQWGFKTWEQDFSDQELQYVIDFYSSATGKKFVQVMPVMMQQLMAALPQYLQESLPKIKNAVMQAAADKKFNIKF